MATIFTMNLEPNTHGAAGGGKPCAIVVIDMVADMFIPSELLPSGTVW